MLVLVYLLLVYLTCCFTRGGDKSRRRRERPFSDRKDKMTRCSINSRTQLSMTTLTTLVDGTHQNWKVWLPNKVCKSDHILSHAKSIQTAAQVQFLPQARSFDTCKQEHTSEVETALVFPDIDASSEQCTETSFLACDFCFLPLPIPLLPFL